MPAQGHEIVLVVQDWGLRGALAARLSIAGGSVTTALSVRPATLRHAVDNNVVLILDDEVVASHPGDWLSGLIESDVWRGIILLVAPDWSDAALHDKVSVVAKENPMSAILTQLSLWKDARA